MNEPTAVANIANFQSSTLRRNLKPTTSSLISTAGRLTLRTWHGLFHVQSSSNQQSCGHRLGDAKADLALQPASAEMASSLRMEGSNTGRENGSGQSDDQCAGNKSAASDCSPRRTPDGRRLLYFRTEKVIDRKWVVSFRRVADGPSLCSHPHEIRLGSNGLARSECLGRTRTA